MLGYPYGWLPALVLLAIAVTSVWLAPLRIRAEFERTGKDDNIAVEFRTLFGLLHYKWSVPFIRLTGGGVDVRNQTNLDEGVLDTETRRDGKVTMESVNKWIERAKRILRQTDDLTGLARHTLSRVEVRKWEWNSAIGTGDAVWTAMATGMIWSIKSTLLGALSQLTRLKTKPSVTVQPEYRGAGFTTSFLCIAQIRFGYAILAGLQLLVRMKKTGGGVRLWQNILFKA